MQDSDKKAPDTMAAETENSAPRHGRHAKAAPAADAPVQEEILPEEDELIGDEGDIPLLKKKKAGKPGKKAAKKKNSKASRNGKSVKKGKASKVPPLFSEKKFRRKKSIFEIMSASGDEGLFRPIHIFGHEIRFWPLFLLAAVLVLVGMIVLSNGNVSLVNQQVTVVGLPNDFENYNILVLSDLNGKRFGDQQSALVRQVESAGYDMILCVGDMVGKGGDPEPFYEFLEGIDDPGSVYFVCGDADPGPYLESPRQIQGTLEQIVLEDWILGAMERGANYVDAPMKLEVGESRLWLTPTSFLNLESSSYMEEWKDQMRQEEDGVISGLVSDYNSLPFTSHRYALAQEFYEAVQEVSTSDLIIGMAHVVPDDAFIEAAATHETADGFMLEPELIVSGHYCGGVWKLPVLGSFYVPNRMLPRNGWFPEQEDASGLSKIGESQVYITNGMSTTSAIPVLPFRVFNDPEICMLTLTAKLPDNMLQG